MKNKELYCRCLLFLIVILIIITNVYAFIKFNIYKEEKTIVSEKKEKNENVNYGVPSGEVGMKLPTSYDEIESILNREYNVMIVFGKTTCSYCQSFYPSLEEITTKYDIEIVYIDMNKLSKNDLNKLLNSKLVIPGNCHKSKKDSYLKDGFGTPLTLFINKKKTYNCLRGYLNKYDLVKQLKNIGYISKN